MQTRSPLRTPTRQAENARARFPWRTTILVIGDALSFLAFAAAGRSNHGEARTLATVATTAFPFALGWFLVSPFAGAFRRVATATVGQMARRTALAWLAAWPVTLVLRWALAPDHTVPVSFAIIILLANVLFLTLWRSIFALVERRVG